jgi:hypothetical protein
VKGDLEERDELGGYLGDPQGQGPVREARSSCTPPVFQSQPHWDLVIT